MKEGVGYGKTLLIEIHALVSCSSVCFVIFAIDIEVLTATRCVQDLQKDTATELQLDEIIYRDAPHLKRWFNRRTRTW